MGFFEANAGLFFAAVLLIGALGGALERRIYRWFSTRHLKSPENYRG